MQKTLARFLIVTLFTGACSTRHDAAGTRAPTGSVAATDQVGRDRNGAAATPTEQPMAPTTTATTTPPPPPVDRSAAGETGKKETEGQDRLADAKQKGSAVGASAGSGSAGPVATGALAYGGAPTPGNAHGRPMPKTAADHGDASSNSESYAHYTANAWTSAAEDHLSTFAADVDTASYTIARRKLTEGELPPADAVRVEEFVNYFKYAYPAPSDGRPFSVTMDAAPSPFAKDRTIVRVGVATKALSIAERKPANLVFLVDTSGSMQSPDKLELAKRSLRILVDNLKDGDTVALVTYAGETRLVLPATGLEHKAQILSAIEDLTAGGGTGMASGIETAYAEAMKGMRTGAISRVLVLTDGDANIGPTSHDEILKLVQSKVKEGVTLSTIGFGMGNYKDDTMEQLADKGNGNAFYVDGLSAAKRIFQEQLGATLEVVAQDVKLQVDFDPGLVKRYRLIGYENRNIADDDFRDDKVDAGEIGAGHQVTAVYEVELASVITADKTPASPLATVRVRWKEPKGVHASEAAYPFLRGAMAPSFAAAPADLRFAFAIAAFADRLRGSDDARTWSLADIRALAQGAAGTDADRAEAVALMDRAIALSPAPKTAIAK